MSNGTGFEQPTFGIGLLGATGGNMAELEANRLAVIEHRILGIEASLRAAGISVIRADGRHAAINAGKPKA